MSFNNNSGQGRPTGTIRKSNSSHNHAIPQMNVFIPNNAPSTENQAQNFLPINFAPTIDLINKGTRVMVILRGLPGSGKSFLAAGIHEKTVSGDPRNHIFSADNFFINRNGQYIFDPMKIQDAHQATQNYVLLKVHEGWSPIIVDNTNVKSWELHAYVHMAVANQYHIEIMEPCTTWAKKVSLLVNLNQHNVPGDGIKRMLDNWEQVSLVNILRELNLDYKRPLQRNHPPIVHSKPEFNTDLPNIESIERPQNNNWQNNWQPKQIENRPHNFQNFQSNIDQNARQMQIQEQLKPLMEILQPTHVSPSVVITPPAEKPQFDSIWESTFVEDVTSKKKAKKAKSSTQPKSAKKISQLLTMEMHKVGCINENQNFANIRELYPNIQAAYLFDLFEKCKGDADWTVNVLLEDSAESGDNTQIPNSELTCECFAGDVAECIPTMELLNQPETPKKTKAQAADWSSAIKAIETNFMFSDEHYTHNMKKVRNWKQGIFTQEPEQENVLVNVDVETTYGNNPTVSTDDAYRNATLKRFEAANPPDPCDLYDVPSDDDSATSSQMDDVIEIDLGHKMVKTLDEMFGGESYKVEIEKNKKLTSKVFMTRSMARQLHALWLESVYSQAEEEKLQRFKEDEEMAKKLMNNLSEYSNPPEPQKSDNLDEIMDMQMALDSYQKQMKNDYQKNQRTDMATKMKHDKLRQLFPNVDLETLQEIFIAHNYNLQDTVETLKFSLPSESNEKLALTGTELIAQAREEMQKVNSGRMDDDGWTTVGKNNKLPFAIQTASRLESEEKREVLNNLEDLRETLEYHRNHRNVCLEKARSSIRDSKYDLATYYNNVANLHKHKLEIYNLKVASCLATIHESTQSNPNMLDLHYMSIYEAVECLHMFLDKHIYKIKLAKIPHKDLLIITGRGNNSIGGVSHIKHKTKGILKERNLKCQEINPGLLKVKIHSNSNMQSK